MAKATVGAAGIEYIQGAMLKPKKQNGHKHGNYLIMTHRSAPTTNPNCQRIYSKPADAYDRTAPVTANELSARTRFTQVAAMVETRRHDLTKITADQAAFLAQKDSPNGCKTIKSWYWRVCGEEWEENQG